MSTVSKALSETQPRLLGANDPAPVLLAERTGPGPLVFCCDHAGALVPQMLGTLGLGPEALNDHIGVDIGIYAVTSWLSALFDAPFVAQPYSRLVIDCNRRFGVPSSIPEVSDARAIPGNQSLSEEARASRRDEILAPYQSALATTLRAQEQRQGRPAFLMAMHSFTRRMMSGTQRTVDIGVIHDGPSPLGDALRAALGGSGLIVQRNEPYCVGLEQDFTIPEHGIKAGRPYLEIEICQDLIGDCAGQRRLAGIMQGALRTALDQVARDIEAETVQ